MTHCPTCARTLQHYELKLVHKLGKCFQCLQELHKTDHYDRQTFRLTDKNIARKKPNTRQYNKTGARYQGQEVAA